MNLLGRGVVYSGAKGTDRQSCAFPSLCVWPGGRWLCSFRSSYTREGNAGQQTLLSWSHDEGASWSEPAAPFPPVRVNGKPGVFRSAELSVMPDGRILATLWWVDYSDPELELFNPETEGLLDSKIFLSTSSDGGMTWTEPRIMEAYPRAVPTPIDGPVLFLPNGDMVCAFEVYKHYDDRGTWAHRSVLARSRDGGRTWPEHVEVGRDPRNRMFYWDQRPAVLRDGTLLDFFWTYDSVLGKHTTVQGRVKDAFTELKEFAVGFPSAVWLPGEQLLVVYYAGEHKDATRIEWVKLGGRPS